MVDLPGYSARTILPLRAVDDSDAVLLGFGPGAGETLHFEATNGEERLTYSGYHLRRVP